MAKKEKEIIKLALLFVLIIILVSGLLVFISLNYLLVSVKEIPYSFNVSKSMVIGLNGDTDALKFGKIPIGGKGKRIITLTSNEKLFVNIKVYGDKKEYISVDKNNFFIYPNQSVNLTFIVNIPLSEPLGDHNGTVKIFFFKLP